ncbi:MAG: phosphoribosylamine--glycine ligase [Calditrichia bacterium]
MEVLVLGSGGREHAIVWKLKQSSKVDKIYCIPGNAGIEQIAECTEIPLDKFEEIDAYIEKQNIDFTVVGPEQPLVDGIVDFLEARGRAVFGPGQKGAQIEGSKIFAKNLMQKYGIPTATYADFTSFEKAVTYINSLEDGKIVVKADGLAAGKGVAICENKDEAKEMLEQMMVEKVFSEAGNRVVIEEYLQGQEASLLVITDGEDYAVLSPAQDFKRALDGDLGRNTGGMGSYAPTPVLTKTMYERAITEIIEPVLKGLKFEGITYKGVLYCGLMITNKGPKVVEFNCRFGDPETQVVLPLLDTDLMELLLAAVQQKLGRQTVKFRKEYAVCVIAASGGYPGAYQKGKGITGLNEVEEDVVVFHAGTRRMDHHVVTNGGRVLGVVALHHELKSAVDKVYRNIKKIRFEGMHYRTDIAERGWKMIS